MWVDEAIVAEIVRELSVDAYQHGRSFRVAQREPRMRSARCVEPNAQLWMDLDEVELKGACVGKDVWRGDIGADAS